MPDHSTQTDITGQHHEAAGPRGTRRGINPHKALRIRRLIGVTIMLLVVYAIFHVIYFTDLLEPVLAYTGPIKDGIDWVMADPTRAWTALAVLIIPHIGLYYFIFDDGK